MIQSICNDSSINYLIQQLMIKDKEIKRINDQLEEMITEKKIDQIANQQVITIYKKQLEVSKSDFKELEADWGIL